MSKPIIDENQTLSPLRLQAYFDEEISNEHDINQLEAMLDDDAHMQLAALAEMRECVRFDVEQATENYNPNVLWNRINRELFAKEDARKLSFWEHIKKFFSEHTKVWVPVAIVAVVALLALPTLIMVLANQDHKQQNTANEHTTYVFLDSQSLSPNTVSYTATKAPVIWFNGGNQPAPQPSMLLEEPQRQLTIQEMDAAIHHLILRIEDLERQNDDVLNNKDLILHNKDISPALNPNL